MAEKRGHAQVKITITKTIKADRGIAPLIAWMNNQHGIQTHFSCQGRGVEGTGMPKPMVSFHAVTRNALFKLLRRVGLDRNLYRSNKDGIELTSWDVHGNTNYKLEWDDQSCLARTMIKVGVLCYVKVRLGSETKIRLLDASQIVYKQRYVHGDPSALTVIDAETLPSDQVQAWIQGPLGSGSGLGSRLGDVSPGIAVYLQFPPDSGPWVRAEVMSTVKKAKHRAGQ